MKRITGAQHDVEIRARRLVFTEVRRVTSHGVRMKDIAARAGVSTATVSKLAYGETKRPQFKTVIGVLYALGFTFDITVPDENVVHMYEKKRMRK